MYRLYIDEFGTDDLTCLDQENHRYLSLTGVIVHLDHVDAVLNPLIREIKNSIFECDPDERIHLHRSDIVRRKKVFGQLNDNAKRERFDGMVLTMFGNVEFKVVTVVIDKFEMTRRKHWQQQHPYHYLLEILVEKYVQFLDRHGTIGDIMPEARQGKKDKHLQDEFTQIWGNGTRFLGADRIQNRLKAKSLKFRRKTDNISGLQLCDMLAHPSHLFVRQQNGHEVNLSKFANQICDLLVEQKYDRSKAGLISGYGYKYCP